MDLPRLQGERCGNKFRISLAIFMIMADFYWGEKNQVSKKEFLILLKPGAI